MNAPDTERPPLGSWPRTYAIACLVAVAVIASLWWVAATFDRGPIR